MQRTSAHGHSRTPEAVVADDRDRAALAALDRAIAAHRLPLFIPGEPRGLSALAVAERQLDKLIAELVRIYELRWDDHEALADIVFDRLLPMWRPLTTIERDDDHVKITSSWCPILNAASRDPRACHVCQLVQQGLLREALPDRVSEVDVHGTIAAGDDTCRVTVHLEPPTARGDHRAP